LRPSARIVPLPNSGSSVGIPSSWRPRLAVRALFSAATALR
jgi:hypothetical protein